MIKRISLLTSAALIAALSLAGCSAGNRSSTATGSGASAGASVEGASNAADRDFAAGMVVHHEQAVEMADMLLVKDGVDARVITLAQQIKKAQGPEITTMNLWLDAWGGPKGDAGASMDGTMSDEEMTALADASGSDAGALFLKQMIVHHEGAVDMSRVQLKKGENLLALELANKIVDDQTNEIAVMKDMLGSM